MFILKSVVGKLWMTMIALVAVILLILGVLLYQYIDKSFPTKTQEQKDAVVRLATRISGELASHVHDEDFIRANRDLLAAQDAGMTIVERNAPASGLSIVKNLHVGDVFLPDEIERIFRGETSVKRAQGEQSDYWIVAVPMTDRSTSEISGSLIVYQSLQSMEETRTYVKKLFALVSLMGFLLTTFFAFFLITRITRPLLQLKQAASLITAGEYESRVPVVSSDEIGELAQTFNRMGARLSATILALSHEKENLGSVLGSMAEAVLSFDADGYVIFTNPHGEELLKAWRDIGWEAGEHGDAETPAAKRIPIPLRHLFDSVVRETKEITDRLNVKNGVWSVVMAPLYADGVFRGAVAVLRDVTEEYRLEKLRKDFVANVSHELRTPLSMLQGYSEALIDDIAASPEDRKEIAQVIHDESLRMGRLVKDLLDLARMEAGHLQLNLQPVELQSLCRRVQRKFAVLCKERDIHIDAQLPNQPIMLRAADEDRLEQVLTNLLDNAIRHTPAGKRIELRADSAVTAAGTPAARLVVEDQGKGIPADDLPYIFERFYKADKARTRGTNGGTGLGLAIVKNIVDAHGGTVTAESEPGRGTTFSIILPQ